MYCGQCGEQLNENAKFCKKCGAPVRNATLGTQNMVTAKSVQQTCVQNNDGMEKGIAKDDWISIGLSIGIIICSLSSWIQIFGEKYTAFNLYKTMKDVSSFVGDLSYYFGDLPWGYNYVPITLLVVFVLFVCLIPIVYGIHILGVVLKKSDYIAHIYTVFACVCFIVVINMGLSAIKSEIGSIVELKNIMSLTFMPYLTCILAVLDGLVAAKSWEH